MTTRSPEPQRLRESLESIARRLRQGGARRFEGSLLTRSLEEATRAIDRLVDVRRIADLYGAGIYGGVVVVAVIHREPAVVGRAVVRVRCAGIHRPGAGSSPNRRFRPIAVKRHGTRGRSRTTPQAFWNHRA